MLLGKKFKNASDHAKIKDRPDAKKRGAPKGVAKGPQASTKFKQESALEIMERMGFNPVEQLVKFAEGDVVALGFMTQAELDEPGRMVLRGSRMVYEPSGREKAWVFINSDLRQNSSKELIKYGWSRKPILNDITSSDGSMAAERVVFYLPDNGRDKP